MRKLEYLQEGDLIEIVEGMKVYAFVPEHFVYDNCKGSWKLTHHDVVVKDNFAYLEGTYVVIKTAIDGGGTGHGPGDVYPDGHHVFCKKTIDGEEIDFYQSGCFTAMIEDIQPKGRAKLDWIIDRNDKEDD